jgi:hypothetical protein
MAAIVSTPGTAGMPETADAGNHRDTRNILKPKQRRDDGKSREASNYRDVITAGTLDTGTIVTAK